MTCFYFLPLRKFRNHRTNVRRFFLNGAGNLLSSLFCGGFFFHTHTHPPQWLVLICLHCYFSASRFFSATSNLWTEEDKWNYTILWTPRDHSSVLGNYCIYSILTVSYATRIMILAHKGTGSSLHLKFNLFCVMHLVRASFW